MEILQTIGIWTVLVGALLAAIVGYLKASAKIATLTPIEKFGMAMIFGLAYIGFLAICAIIMFADQIF